MSTQPTIRRTAHRAMPIELSPSDTEQVSGGLIGLLLLGGAALLFAGCQSCTAHGSAGRKPTTPRRLITGPAASRCGTLHANECTASLKPSAM